MVYSRNCKLLHTFWSGTSRACVECKSRFEIKAGYEFSPNCGILDDGGRAVPAYTKCKSNTFNNGSFDKCQRCSICSAGRIFRECSITADTRCCQNGQQDHCEDDRVLTTTMRMTGETTFNPVYQDARTSHSVHLVAWIVPIILVVLVLLLLIWKKRNKIPFCFRFRDREQRSGCTKDSLTSAVPPESVLYENLYAKDSQEAAIFDDLTPLQSEASRGPLSLEIQSAPLQIVLDNLDVVEELIILLDPERPGIKTTRHLASRCAFPSTWITYTYSLKESRSPLRAVLEGVTTRHPDWTVRHLVQLLQEMGRNDAVLVLAKLSLSKEIV